MNRKECLEQFMKLQFFALDLNLYLDNFHCCSKAQEDYKFISKQLDKAKCEYEEKYGPLTNFGSAYVENPEKWIDTPWPWERM